MPMHQVSLLFSVIARVHLHVCCANGFHCFFHSTFNHNQRCYITSLITTEQTSNLASKKAHAKF